MPETSSVKVRLIHDGKQPGPRRSMERMNTLGLGGSKWLLGVSHHLRFDVPRRRVISFLLADALIIVAA
jgi:hypothetical protein